MLQGRSRIQDHYRCIDIARRYIGDRFFAPVGALIHDRQLSTVLRLVHDQRPGMILDLAAGPARISADLIPQIDANGIIVDASSAMISIARERVGALRPSRNHWNCAVADGFTLPFGQIFDLVCTFRLIRHFQRADRISLYKESWRVLKPGGVLVFDAVNRRASQTPSSKASSTGEKETEIVYDALVSPAELVEELSEAGFELIALTSILHCPRLLIGLQSLLAPRAVRLAHVTIRLLDALLRFAQPEEWIVTCRRK